MNENIAMTRISNETYMPDLENRELRELVGLLLAIERRAESAFEAARGAHLTGDQLSETAAMTRLKTIERSSHTLAGEIRAIDPDFPFLKVQGWFALARTRQPLAQLSH
jgi:hypothetical protein